MTDEIYKAIAERSPHINFVYDIRNGAFNYTNEVFNEIAGNAPPSVETLKKIVDPSDYAYLTSCYRQLIADKKKEHISFRIRSNHQTRWLRLAAFYMNVSGGEFIVGFASDITAEANNLETIKKFANKKNSALTILAHDLRGPLGIANTLTQALNKKIEDPFIVNQLQTVSKILKQAIYMIGDLTDREFLETTEADLVKERVDIAIKLRDYIQECQNSEDIARREFRFSSSHENIFIHLDEAKFMQIVNNLISNSLKFTREDGKIQLKIEDKQDSVIFAFSDNGIGIPEQYHSTLFQKFTAARRKGLQGEPTIGLGLSIVKTIVEWHQGSIWFESKEGEGTTFFVEIPKLMD